MQEALQNMHWAEVAAVICGLIYVILVTKENIWCWFWGGLNALLSIYLFVEIQLYAESILYAYYFIAAIYGWYAWKYAKRVSDHHGIIEWPWQKHLFLILAGFGLSYLLYLLLSNYTDAQMPLVDAHTTIFSFLATYLVTRKVLSNWLYWIVIDAISVWLYVSRGIELYAFLMFIYTIIAVLGYFQWRKMQLK
ncbi:MAG: nicotinamide riboside transporter PnuC [Saprospiraceae bacterium]